MTKKKEVAVITSVPDSKTRKKVGRHTLLTPDLQEKIVELIRLGNYAEDAAGASGISRSTFFGWIVRGRAEQERLRAYPNTPVRADEKPFLEFLNAVEKARDEATARNVAIIQREASKGTWQAAAWWLERTRQHTFGRKERVEMTGEGGAPLRIQVDAVDLEEKISQVLEARKG